MLLSEVGWSPSFDLPRAVEEQNGADRAIGFDHALLHAIAKKSGRGVAVVDAVWAALAPWVAALAAVVDGQRAGHEVDAGWEVDRLPDPGAVPSV